MNPANVLLLMVAIVLLLFSFAFKIASYTGQIKLDRIPIIPIVVSIAVIFLACYFGVRWLPAIENAVNHTYSKTDNPMQYNTTYSWSLLLDFCPMLAVVVSISMMSKVGRKFLGHIAPLAFYAGAMVIFGSKILISDATLTVDYLIIGNKEPGVPYNSMTLIVHLFIMTVGLNALLYKDRYNRYDALIMLTFISVFLSYVAIMMTSLDINSVTSGLNKYDYVKSDNNINPDFNFFYNLFKGVPFWCVPILTYMFHSVVIAIISWIKIWSTYHWPSKAPLNYTFGELLYLSGFKNCNKDVLMNYYIKKYYDSNKSSNKNNKRTSSY